MKEASKRVGGAAFPNVDQYVVEDLKKVALAFVYLQQQRHLADYDYLETWSRADALEYVLWQPKHSQVGGRSVARRPRRTTGCGVW